MVPPYSVWRARIDYREIECQRVDNGKAKNRAYNFTGQTMVLVVGWLGPRTHSGEPTLKRRQWMC
jgi:hypothetical protein